MSSHSLQTQQISNAPPVPLPFNNTKPPPILITQGAEALLYRTHFLTSSIPAALKVRPSKPYRHPTLDARLTKQRVLAEARVLVKLSGVSGEGVRVPGVLGVEWDLGRRVKGLPAESRGVGGEKTGGGGAWLVMEWIEGGSVKDLLRQWDVWYRTIGQSQGESVQQQIHLGEEEVKKLLRRIGRAVGIMHTKGGVVHGDLTTSNVMVRPYVGQVIQNGDRATIGAPSLEGEIVLIDFGLATQSIQDEDRAVDLYVLERAFGSTHPRQEGWFDAEVLQSKEGYRGAFKGSQVVLKRLEDVRLRGRKRSMLG